VVTTSYAAPARVVLDTDIGTYFDDFWALMYIISRPDIFDLRLVQVSTYNTPHRAQIVAKVLDLVNRMDIPIGIGYANGENPMPEYPWAQDYSLDTFKQRGGKIIMGTSALLAEMKRATPTDPTYIVEIAPANSLGDILLVPSNVGLAKNCICVAMSGSVYLGYGNSSTPDEEYNVVQNISSSQAMYNSVWLKPLVTAPLDTTNFEQWDGKTYQPLVLANNTDHLFVQILLENYQVWYDNGGKDHGGFLPFTPTTGTDVLFDAQAAWMAGKMIAQETFDPLVMSSLHLRINSDGYSVIDPAHQPLWVNSAVGLQSTLTYPYISIDQIGSQIINSIINPTKI
jgi:inosine-uridine nucleoside N-ribohydrolase